MEQKVHLTGEKQIFLLQKELWQCSGTIFNNAKLGILNRLESRQKTDK